ncbi:phage tail tape measure protein [Desulfovibrio sp. ZJ200]|uniref:phage tail tape measure protein n=1 Tax=Desulfovibrio sp. ZJ200 TaxID=2709792 RepID=UPI0013EDA924|nr:phage tail tape measure protein [Desulfovibrio sp. ZJ200]
MNSTFGVGFAVGATLSPTVANVFSTVEHKIKSSAQRVEALTAKTKALARAQALRADVAATQRLYAASGGQDPLIRETLNTQLAAYQKARAEAARYGVAVADYGRAHTRAQAQLERTRYRLEALSKAQAAEARRKELRGGMMEAAVPAMAVAAPIKMAMGFETAMADVRKVTNFDAAGLKSFGNELLDMSTRIPMTAEGLTQIAAAAGQAGIAQNELLAFTEDAAVMATAFDMSAEDAGSAMTGMRTNFKLTQDEVRLLGDSINHLSNRYDAKASELVNFVSRVGGTAATFRMTGQEVAALGTVFRATKVDTESAATAANAMFVRLGNAGKLPREAQEALAGLGISAQGMAEAMQKDAQGAMLQFLRQVKASRNPLAALSAVFGTEHAPKIVKLVGSLDLYEKALKDVADKGEYAGSQQDEFNNVTDTASARLRLATNAAGKAAIELGTALLPAVSSILETVTPYISAIGTFASEHETLTTVAVGAVAGFTALRVAGMGASYMVSGVSGSFHMARAALSFLIPGLRATAAAEGAVAAASNAGRMVTLRAGMAWVGHKAALLGGAIASKAAAAGQWLLNSAFLACPLTWIVLAVGAFIGAMVSLYKTCEPVRAAFDAVFGFIGDKMSWAMDKLRAVGEWLGIVDEADEKADAKLAEAKAAQGNAATAAVAGGDTAAIPAMPDLGRLPAAPEAPRGAMPDQATLASLSGPGDGRLPVMPEASGMTGPGGGLTVNIPVTLSGITDAGFARRLLEALRAHKGDFEKLISEIVHDQERLAYE